MLVNGLMEIKPIVGTLVYGALILFFHIIVSVNYVYSPKGVKEVTCPKVFSARQKAACLSRAARIKCVLSTFKHK